MSRKPKTVKTQPSKADLSEPLVLRRAQVFEETIVAGLTPVRLAQILKESTTGYSAGFFRLAEEMEELDPHYRAVLQIRKLAISGIEPEVTAAGEDAQSKEVAEFVKALVEAPIFADLITDLLDGLGKGYSVVEIIWDTSGNQWKPSRYIWHEPEHFKYDRASGQMMHLLEDGKTEPLQPLRFAVHVPHLKSGIPVRGALARMAAWSFLFKNYTVKDWMRFIEVFGMPVRIGKYGPNATEDDKKLLLRAVANIGSDAAAIMPQNMALEFAQTASGTAAQGPVFGQMADYLDKQVSKGVLGQTMTADNGSSKAQATIHNEVRLDILKADARQLMMTLLRDVIHPAVRVNFGDAAPLPKTRLPVEEPEDVTAWVTNAGKMMDKGLKVSIKQTREKLGVDEPVDDDDVLGTTLETPEDDIEDDEGNQPKKKPLKPVKKAKTSRHAVGCACCGGHALLSQEDKDQIDELVTAAINDDEGALDGLIEPILALASSSKSFDEFTRGLTIMAGQQNVGVLMDKLGPLMFMARGLGDASDEP